MDELFESLREKYQSKQVPWDDELPPPEVQEFISSLTPGRAIDLGCGYGRASIYLASKGWDVDGVDFIPEAVCTAAKRAQDAGLAVRFHVARVTDLDFLAGPYNFALDVGCCHNLSEEMLRKYHKQLKRLQPEGSHFMLFARIREEDGGAREGTFSGLDLSRFLRLFANGYRLIRQELGVTNVQDQPEWRSGWFLFERTSEK